MGKNHSKKYRLIRKYPNSPELGTIVKIDSKQETGYYSENKEFWEEVIEKEYEILSFKSIKGNIVSLSYFSCESNFIGNNIWKIHSIKRNDGEIFTIGDIAKQSNVTHNNTFTITGFELDVNKKHLLVLGNGGIRLSKIEKVKTPIFTTEDGVEVFEGDEVTWICGVQLEIGLTRKADKYMIKNLKYFSTKEKAEEYINLNKPCLSIKEICPIIGQCNNTTYIDLDKLTERLKELVKTKL